TEAIRHLVGMNGGLEGRLMMVEMGEIDLRFIKLKKQKNCRFCSNI
ncbi:MAG TPA: molybdopterin-synthase adenylyltransferase MoeB, partial [Alphaproteobacteria bacterium]|nr:molybdopterin-synthase adenylyltransferase MoeB [Alphaproteobacteria bacterium]